MLDLLLRFGFNRNYSSRYKGRAMADSLWAFAPWVIEWAAQGPGRSCAATDHMQVSQRFVQAVLGGHYRLTGASVLFRG